MAFTVEDLATIDQAIALGAKRVRFQTHEAEYPSVSEMLRARDVIKRELEGANSPANGGAIYAEYGSDY